MDSGLLIDIFHEDSVYHGIGKLDSGETFYFRNPDKKPRLYVRNSDASFLHPLNCQSKTSRLSTLDGESTLEVMGTPSDLRHIRESLSEKGERVDRFYNAPEIRNHEAAWTGGVSVLVIDIETRRTGDVFAIALLNYQSNSPEDRIEELHVVGEDFPGNVYSEEKSLLEGIYRRIVELDPDVIRLEHH